MANEKVAGEGGEARPPDLAERIVQALTDVSIRVAALENGNNSRVVGLSQASHIVRACLASAAPQEKLELPYALVHIFLDGRIVMDGSSMVDIQMTGHRCEGKPFRQLGHLGPWMLFLEEAEPVASAAPQENEPSVLGAGCGVSTTPLNRLRELASEGAEQNHEDDALFEEGRGGHDGDFSVCSHPDCVLVRAVASAAPPPPPQATSTKRERYLARRMCPQELTTALVNARLEVNDWHTCATPEELGRWREAQQRLIDAAEAVGAASVSSASRELMAAPESAEGVAASAAPPRNEWRRDDKGELDDVVVDDVACFRMERMTHDHIWGAVHRNDGSRTTFDIHGNRGAKVSLRHEEDPAAAPPEQEKPRFSDRPMFTPKEIEAKNSEIRKLRAEIERLKSSGGVPDTLKAGK